MRTRLLLLAASLACLLLSAHASNGQDCVDYSTNPLDPVLGSVDFDNIGIDYQAAGDIASVGNRAVVSANFIETFPNGSLFVADITDPENPAFVGEAVMDGLYPGRVAFDGVYAYLIASFMEASFILVYDVTGPQPVQIGSVPATGSDLALASGSPSDRLYVADDQHLRVIDVSNPTNPTLIGSVAFTTRVVRIAVEGDHAYLAGFSPVGFGVGTLVIVDVSNPTSPAVVGTFEHPTSTEFYDVAVRGDLVAVGTYGSPELVFIDVADPTAPELLDAIPGPGKGSVAFGESGIFYALGGQLFVYDVSAPTSPSLIGTGFRPDDFASRGPIAVTGSKLCVGSYYDPAPSRFEMLPAQCPLTTAAGDHPTPAAAVTLTPAHPNPFRLSTAIDYHLLRPLHIRLRVTDVHGRVVRRLEDGSPRDAGHYTITWDGRNDGGRRVAPGVYFVTMDLAGSQRGSDGGDHEESIRLTLLE
jgi:hypothetical protein